MQRKDYGKSKIPMIQWKMVKKMMKKKKKEEIAMIDWKPDLTAIPEWKEWNEDAIAVN